MKTVDRNIKDSRYHNLIAVGLIVVVKPTSQLNQPQIALVLVTTTTKTRAFYFEVVHERTNY